MEGFSLAYKRLAILQAINALRRIGVWLRETVRKIVLSEA